jgi:hypothetical protein
VSYPGFPFSASGKLQDCGSQAPTKSFLLPQPPINLK